MKSFLTYHSESKTEPLPCSVLPWSMLVFKVVSLTLFFSLTLMSFVTLFHPLVSVKLSCPQIYQGKKFPALNVTNISSIDTIRSAFLAPFLRSLLEAIHTILKFLGTPKGIAFGPISFVCNHLWDPLVLWNVDSYRSPHFWKRDWAVDQYTLSCTLLRAQYVGDVDW